MKTDAYFNKPKQIQILGIRGIPAEHGGFETFAEQFSLYLVKNGWQVTVYCQINNTGPITQDFWQGIKRVNIPVPSPGAKGTIIFDWISTRLAASKKIPVLLLGYNTAVFSIFYRLKNIPNIINMDGIEWRRAKYNTLARAWLLLNEKLGAMLGNHLIADHPEIKNHLAHFSSPSKITTIPYGATLLKSADASFLEHFSLEPGRYAILVARPEPENSILDIVKAYSIEKRGIPLIILGDFKPDDNRFHNMVMDAANKEILFPGAIYDQPAVQALRYYARYYIHGHRVGGTNPSLVEALGAGSAVLAHGNRFNRWVTGNQQIYFSSRTAVQRPSNA